MIPEDKGVVFAEGSPQRALVEFIKAWAEADFDGMLAQTQLTWRATVPSPKELLKAMFRFKPVRVRVLEESLKNDVVYEAEVSVEFFLARSVIKANTLTAKVICEKEPLFPSADGTWGVNPVTMMVS